MVFFNYSTMQMAAKIVYYGPGLCGKTTNLQHIYGHTSQDSRGEMVSLETETDRTLFFDLLPIDVGSIQGFNTRIQLYTVPGQVFYNTTRKLVLKGVDGVVFVADSQRAMVQANIESFGNLGENLAEIGLSTTQLPLVLQYNKRDLADICTVEEMDQAINTGDWPSFEAAAISGAGVFETLKGISKLTLLSLKKRIADSQRGETTPQPRVRPKPPKPAPAPAGVPPAAPQTATPAAVPVEPAVASPPAPVPETASANAAADQPTGSRKQVDILAELEKIRRQAMGLKASPTPKAAPSPPPALHATNGNKQLTQNLHLALPKDSLEKAKRFSLNLELQDENGSVLGSLEEFGDMEDAGGLEKLLLSIALGTEDLS